MTTTIYIRAQKMTKQIQFCPKTCSSSPWPSCLVLFHIHDFYKMSVLDTMFLHSVTLKIKHTAVHILHPPIMQK